MKFSNQGFRYFGLGVLLAMASCTEDPGPTAPPNVNPNTAGSFQVEMKRTGPDAGYTAVLGQIYTGPSPSPVGWKKIAEAGSCRLFTPTVPFCNPGCGSGATCVEDGKCQDYPKPIGAGKVTAKGIKTKAGATEFVMDPPLSLTYQQPAGTILEFHAFEEGAPVSMSAAGDTGIPAFTVSAKGISPLVVLDDSLPLPGGQPIILKWTAAKDPTASVVSVLVDLSHHGGSKGKIECEGPDNGTLEIPAALADQLKALGVAGYPKLEATRKATGTNADVHVDLVLLSQVVTLISIPGLISCTENAECPNGKTCDPDNKICK
jgi:hypothetical protein